MRTFQRQKRERHHDKRAFQQHPEERKKTENTPTLNAHPHNKQNQPPPHNFHTIMSLGRKSRREEGTNRRSSPDRPPGTGWADRHPPVGHPSASFLFCAAGVSSFHPSFPFPRSAILR